MCLLRMPSRVLTTLLFGLTCLAWGREGLGAKKDCQTPVHETKECLPRYNLCTYEDESENFTLEYDATRQIIFSRCDLQTGEEKDLSIGLPENLHSLANETEVSLINQIFMVENAKKRSEALYIIKSHNHGKCLAQIYLTVLDPPPSVDATPTSNVNISVSSPASPFGSNSLYIALGLPVVLLVVAVTVFRLRPNWIKCLKRDSSTSEYAASFRSSSTVESGLVMNGFEATGRDHLETCSGVLSLH